MSRQRDQWTQETVIAAIRAHAAAHDGNPPKSTDWFYADPGKRPTTGKVQRLFGSWADGIVAAGFPRPVRGGYPRLKIDLPFEDAVRAALETPAPRNGDTPVSSDRPALETFRADEVIPVQLPMIWRDRIPHATLTVIAGVSGLGKSTLITAIAAELSRKSLTGIISNLEDDPASVTRPRLDVAGAKLERVHLVPWSSAPMLPRDLDRVRDLIVATRASYLVLDPVAAHFYPESRVHDRPTLRRLIQIAHETRCAIIGVHHTVKNSNRGGGLVGLIGGPAGGLGGSCRAAYLFGFDPADEDRRALVYAKGNGFDAPAALIMSHETVEYDAANGQRIEAGAIAFTAESHADARRVLKRGRHNKERDAACAEWLTLFLAAGDDCTRQETEIRRDGRSAGFSWQALLRARATLKLDRNKLGFDSDGFWVWRLPDEHPLRQQEQPA